MLVEAIERPIRYQLLGGQQVRLTPGCPVDLPEGQALMLLAKAPGRVCAVAAILVDLDIVICEPVRGGRPVFWEDRQGKILGPGYVSHVAKAVTEGKDAFWLCIEYRGSWRWVHECLLRSRPGGKS